MIFPDEYKYVGVTHVHPDEAYNEPVYFLSKYIIVEKIRDSAPYYSIYKVEHSGDKLLRDVKSITLIADNEEILKCQEIINLKNRKLLLEKAVKLCDSKINTIIFTGPDRHVTFVKNPNLCNLLNIEILDVIPPEPSWLNIMIKKLDQSGIFGDLCINFIENTTDLRQFENNKTIFPCSSSGIKGKYLDCDVITENGYLLVGCEISKKIFETRFPLLQYDFLNICPFNSHIYAPSIPFITRCCCNEKLGIVNINGSKGAVVHWGASEFEVALAIRTLVGELRQGE